MNFDMHAVMVVAAFVLLAIGIVLCAYMIGHALTYILDNMADMDSGDVGVDFDDDHVR